jgi:4-hydroxy-4-methyl-2-oxoglutarate aldolase
LAEKHFTGLVPPERMRKPEGKRCDSGIIAQYQTLSDLTSTVGDVLDRLGLVGVISAHTLKPLCPGKTLVGPAVTLRYVPDRVSPGYGHAHGLTAKLGGHFDAYTLSEPGDVLVVDGGGIPEVSSLGGLSVSLARQAGLAGIVVDGCVRDVAGTRELGFPLWARGATPRTGKFRLEVAEINGIITCAGIQVQAYDLILADDDGVVVVPNEFIEKVLGLAQEAVAKEQKITKAMSKKEDMDGLKDILSPDKW